MIHDLRRTEPASHLRVWAAVERSFRWSPSRTAAWRLDQLQGMVVHAHTDVPYYAARGAAPQIGSFDEFAAVIPTVDSSTLRSVALEDRLAAPVPPGTQRFTTSGSTGEPAVVLYPPTVRRLFGGLKSRMTAHRRINPTWRWARLTASDTTDGLVAERPRRMLLPATAPVAEHVAALERFRPAVLTGYPHLLVEIAEHLPRPHRLRAVTTLGEQLDDGTRHALRTSYGCEVYDTYGANEVGAIAWQCSKADLYHLNHESIHVEVVDDDGRPVPDGTAGHVVVTDLANGLFPHLRYHVGDTAVIATRPCRCGNELPAFQTVSGRTLDWLVGTDGNRMAPERLWMDLVVLIDDMAAVRRYQIRQLPDRSVRIAVVPADGALDQGFAARVGDAYRQVLGAGIPVSVEAVDRIEPLPSGKYPMIVSEVEDVESRHP